MPFLSLNKAYFNIFVFSVVNGKTFVLHIEAYKIKNNSNYDSFMLEDQELDLQMNYKCRKTKEKTTETIESFSR